jgi:hypothetical protein
VRRSASAQFTFPGPHRKALYNEGVTCRSASASVHSRSPCCSRIISAGADYVDALPPFRAIRGTRGAASATGER